MNDTSGEFPATTAIGIVSQGNGAAFNGWTEPSAREASRPWLDALEFAEALIDGGALLGASEGITQQTLFFQSCDPPLEPVEEEDNIHVAADVGACNQYYYDALPTYRCAPAD